MCLNEADVAARKNCIATLNECACICKEAASFMAIDSKYAKDICKLCEKICNDCATECGMFKDSHCQTCAQECKACASMCASM